MAEPLIQTPAQAPCQLARIQQLDALVGMGISNIIALFHKDNARLTGATLVTAQPTKGWSFIPGRRHAGSQRS